MSQQLIFINGPTISASVNTEQRRLIRSRIASRGRHRAPPLVTCSIASDHEDDAKSQANVVTSSVTQNEGVENIDTAERLERQDLQIWSPVSGVQFEPCPESGVSFFDNCTRDAIDYRIRVILPDFRQLDHYSERYFRAFVLEAKNKSLAVSATILNALVHKSLTRLVNREEHTTNIRVARYKVIQLVRQEMMTEDYRLADLLSAILILATTEPETNSSLQREINPFTPPALGSKWMEVYTRKPKSQVHWQAVEAVIRMHGGIHQLKTYGSAWQISLTGLMKSAMSVTHPPYPLISPDGHEYPDISTLQYLDIQNTPAHVSAMGAFALLQLKNIKEKVLGRFTELREFMWVIDNLGMLHSQLQIFHTDQLMDCRNLIQHRLLSLPAASEQSDCLFEVYAADCQQTRAIYGACRTTALLFSIHVLFPLPAPSSPRAILLDHLVMFLSSVNIIEEILLPGWSEMALWCSFVGGIAALNSDKRGYFVTKIKDTALASGLEIWEQVREVLQRFVWLGSACDSRAVELWREACILRDDNEG